MERGFDIGTDEGLLNVRKFVDELEFECWHIDGVLVGYIVAFAKATGIAEDTIPRDSVYSRNLHKYFSPEIDWKRHNKKPGRPG